MKNFTERVSARIARNAKPREHNVRVALDERVKAHGGVTRAVTWIGRTGAPDVLALFPDRSVWVETKVAVTGRLGKHQEREHEALRAAGCQVLVISTMQHLDDWLAPL